MSLGGLRQLSFFWEELLFMSQLLLVSKMAFVMSDTDPTCQLPRHHLPLSLFLSFSAFGSSRFFLQKTV
jgi:hypothetical protein